MTSFVMIDCETLGVGDMPWILSIGMVVYRGGKLHAGHHFHIDQTLKQPGTIDAATVQWWMNELRQGSQSYPPFRCLEEGLRPRRLDVVMDHVAEIILRETQHCLDVTVWSNGVEADIKWLRNVSKTTKNDLFNSVVDFRKARCFRTVRATVAPQRHKRAEVWAHTECQKYYPEPRQHDALYDALWQASYLAYIQGVGGAQ